jgi:hypothetical protein
MLVQLQLYSSVELQLYEPVELQLYIHVELQLYTVKIRNKILIMMHLVTINFDER